jgi:Inner membrane component of T3SS, cytoplasmic domain
MSDASDPIRIERDELFTAAVDSALARERAGRERILMDAPPVSPLRRLLQNGLFYLPLAAVLGALAAWLLIEPVMTDMPIIGGEVTLINAEPFDAADGVVSVTVGDRAVLVSPPDLLFERGEGLRAEGGGEVRDTFTSFEEISVGTRVELAAVDAGDGRLVAVAARPTADPRARADEGKGWAGFVLFPLTALAIALGLLLSEGISTRNWMRMISRSILGSVLAALFAMLAFIPAGVMMSIGGSIYEGEAARHPELFVLPVEKMSAVSFLAFTACRSAAWAFVGAGVGLGMNLVRSTRAQLRNSVIGGTLGGAFGGMFFDPIDRFFDASMFAGAEASRAVGLCAVGLSIGLFVALVERLGREAWLRVRTGPLAGKAFILYKTPTLLGNDPSSDIYLYKDAGIDPTHAAIHRVGAVYEIEDQGSRTGTSVGGSAVRRRRLASGDQIILGSTVLDFEERQNRTPAT